MLSDSQLTATLFAYHHLTNFSIADSEVPYLRGLALAEGSLKSIWDRLGIEEDERIDADCSQRMKAWAFYEACTFSEAHGGYHYIGVILHNSGLIRVYNADEIFLQVPYIIFDDLKPFLKLNEDRTKPRWNLRSFRIKKSLNIST